MSIVKHTLEYYREEKVKLFLSYVMLNGGIADLKKRRKEAQTALDYLKLFNKDSKEIKPIKRDLKNIDNGLKVERKKLYELEKIQYLLERFKKPNRFRMYYFLSDWFHNYDLDMEETQMVKDHIEQNYNQRKPFPYPNQISIHFDGHYCIE